MTTSQVPLFIISLVLCILSMVGNGLICRAVYLRKRTSIVYLMIAYQAMSDIVYGVSRVLSFPLCQSFESRDDRFHILSCELFKVVIPTATYSMSAHCMTVIAYYRFKMVYFVSAKRPTMARIKVIIGFILVSSSIGAILVSVGYETDANFGGQQGCLTVFAELADYDFFSHHYGLGMVFFENCVIQSTVTCIFYVLIVKKMASRSLVGQISTEREKRLQEKKVRMTKMLIVIVVSYYALTLPVSTQMHLLPVLLSVKFSACGRMQFPDKSFWGLMLMSVSTVVNPVILYHFDVTFRTVTRETFSSKRRIQLSERRVIGYPICHSTSSVPHRHQVLGCEILKIVIPTASYSVSAHCMAVIAYYRFKMVYFVDTTKPTMRQIKFTMLLILVSSFLGAILVAVGYEMNVKFNGIVGCMTVFVNLADHAFFNKHYGLVLGFSMNCLFHYIVTCIFYILIMTKVASRSQVGHMSTDREKRFREKKNRMTKMLIVIVTSYYFLTLPVTSYMPFVTIILREKYSSCGKTQYMGKQFCGHLMMSLSTVVNPLILYHFDNTFKTGNKKSFVAEKMFNRTKRVFTRSNQVSSDVSKVVV
ncbi:hypothetical protein HDE_07617 [Halotydeus destructor]|nr:hypothetical protein HDE_07617 [Halotydeus destructor]